MACTRFRKVKRVRFQDVQFTRYTQVTRLVHATRASKFVRVVEENASALTDEDVALHAAVDPRGRVSLPHCVDELAWFMPWGLLEKMMERLLQEGSTSWPRSLYLRPREPPQDIPRTTYVAVLRHLMQIYERFYVGRQDHRVSFVSGSVRLGLERE